MERLLTLDLKDYTDDMPVFEKYTVRAIIMRDGRLSMQLSGRGEYKIPGGGVEGDARGAAGRPRGAGGPAPARRVRGQIR